MNDSEESHGFFTACKVGGNSYVILSQFPKEEYKRSRIAVLFVNCILFFLTIFLNGISIITIRRSSQLRGKVCSFVMLLQSVFDLGVGVVAIPFFIFYLLFPFLSTSNCTFTILARRVTRVTCGLSVVTLSAMTLERYIGVLHPYYYEAKFTKKKILIYMGTFVLCIFPVLAYSFRDDRVANIFTRVLRILFFVFTAFAYVKIYRVIRKLIRSEKRPACESHKKRSIWKRQIRERRQATSCFLVVACFAFFLLPSLLSAVAFRPGTVDFVVYQNWSITLLILNSSVNSLIFFWTKTLLRKEASKIIKSFFS